MNHVRTANILPNADINSQEKIQTFLSEEGKKAKGKKVYKMFDIASFGHIPIEALEDVSKRISDWIASGGKEEDEYIQRQIQYLERLAKGNKSI